MSKWFLEVVQDFDGSYYANLTVDGVLVDGLPEYVDYNTLKNAIKAKTGIEILKKKDMIFQQDGRKKYAYIDATQYRGEGKDCRITFDEIKNGWKPKFDTDTLSMDNDARSESHLALDEQIAVAKTQIKSANEPIVNEQTNDLTR